jgi:hypothetical protein
MPSTTKKVIVRKRGRDTISGYVAPAHYLSEGQLELLDQSGKVVLIDLAEVKSVDSSRPRTEGLWVRLLFSDNDIVEGMMPNDLAQMAPEGYLITPPDTRGNVQRIFVPRSALEQLIVLGVIGRPETRRKAAAAEDERQERLFTEQ